MRPSPPPHPLPQVEVTFLRSYEGFLGAEASIDAPGCERLPAPPSSNASEPALQGWWARRVSAPFTLTWATAADDGEALGGDPPQRSALPPSCRLERGREYTLNVTLRGSPAAPPGASRFKLMRVSACGLFLRQDVPCCR